MALGEALDILMFVTACGFLLLGFPVAFTLAGTAILFAMAGAALGAFDLSFLIAYPQRIFGIVTSEILVAVPLFIFMGVMLERSRVAEDLLEAMASLFGRLRGGLGISVSVVGCLLAASTGIVGATVVTMGLLSLPTMLKRGYDPAFACGSICAAGTLGQIIPPSIVLILLGDVIFRVLSVGAIGERQLRPGLRLRRRPVRRRLAARSGSGRALHRLSDPGGLAAAGRGTGCATRRATAMRGATRGYLVRALVPPFALLIAVLGSILVGLATPTEAAAVGAVGAILLAAHRLKPDRPGPVYGAAGCLAGMLLFGGVLDLRLGRESTGAVDATGIAVALALTIPLAWGLGPLRDPDRAFGSGWRGGAVHRPHYRHGVHHHHWRAAFLIGLPRPGRRRDGGAGTYRHAGGAMGAVAVVMAVMFALGFFLDFIEIVFVVVPVVAPALFLLDVNPVWLAIMMAVNLQTSFLTPPFGFALFYLRGVAPDSVTTLQIYKGVVPFVAIQLLALVLLATFPETATWLPKAMFG